MMVVAIADCQWIPYGQYDSKHPHLVKYRTSECSMPAMRSSVVMAVSAEGVLPFILVEVARLRARTEGGE
jgi:hypothetical protein